MAMFGSALKKLASPENLYLLGATLKDISAGGSDNFQGAQSALQQRQVMAQRQAAQQRLTGLFGGQRAALTGPDMQGNPGETAGVINGSLPSLRNPIVAQQIIAAAQAGVDVSPYLKVLEASQPDLMVGPNGVAFDKGDPGNVGKDYSSAEYINGFKANANDPTSPSFIPKIPDATMPDGKGGVIPIGGAAEAVARQEALVAGAKAAAASPYDFIQVPTPSGAPRTMAKSVAAGGDFTGQAPADAQLAQAQAQGRIALPQAVQTAQQTLDLINQIRNHPGRESATGIGGVLPGIPGTTQRDFVALLDQAKGKAFLEAFDSLKGGGQITEVEGRKATDAIARLDRAQSRDGFLKALDDLQGVVETGMQRAQQRAGRPPAQPSRADVAAELRRRGLIR